MSMIGNYLAIAPAQAEQLEVDPIGVEGVISADDLAANDYFLDTDKSWHGMHYLLTGSAWGGEPPLSWVVMPPRELGEDVGYGPARLLRPDEVKAVAEALAAVTSETLTKEYDPVAMESAEVYPQGWGADDVGYVTGYFESVKALFERAAQQGMGMLVWLN